jgi:hypothetical protein
MSYAKPMIALLVLLGASQAASAEPDAAAFTFGFGLKTCRVWRENQQNFDQGSEWVAGYWSALNVKNRSYKLVGRLSQL